MIFATNISAQCNKSFIFTMKLQEPPFFEPNSLISILNPNKLLYGICFISDDYLEITKNKNKREFFLVPRVYCFITYYPFIKLFIDLIVMILSKLLIYFDNYLIRFYEM